jgi:multidrug efflux pump subunit AcrB
MSAGLLSIFTVKMEIFPEASLDTITVTVPYLGASPEDVEKGVTLRVEEAVAAIEGVKRLTSTASEGSSLTLIEVEEYVDIQEVLDDVKAAVDRITTFPKETEKPVIAEFKFSSSVITVVVSGDVSEKTLKKLAEQIRNDLTVLEDISQVSVTGVRPYEISIEISEEILRRYGLSFDQVAGAVRESSLDIPGGSVKTAGGEILVRTKDKTWRHSDGKGRFCRHGFIFKIRR